MLRLVFEILETTPAKVQREISTLSPREMKTRPAPGKWSIQEVLAHLEDIEEVGMRARVAAMIEQKNPLLPAIDQEARALSEWYDRRDPRRSLASFTRQRRANLRWLRKLRPAQFKRKGLHATVGEISVGELLNEWAFHDLGHLKQILEIKRYGLFPRMGNMKAFYQLS